MPKLEVIRSLVLQASVGFSSSQAPIIEFVRYLAPNDTRAMIYICCLDLINEEQRRRDIGLLMLNYVPSFPPSKKILGDILERCKLFIKKTAYAAVYKDLRNVVEPLYKHVPLQYLRGKTQQALKPPLAAQRSDVTPNPAYIAKFALQTPVDVSDKGRSFINLRSDKLLRYPQKKNHVLQCNINCMPARCKDYIDQSSLICSEDIIEQQLGVLTHFWDRYRNNSTVINATSFLMKQMCDAYVAKIPLGPPYQFFRTVSICYLPILFEWMESDYLCVRNHVYDFLLTLGMHFQLIDTYGMYKGATNALQRELVWMLLCVLERQSLLKLYDVLTWTAASKCAIALIPHDCRHLIDPRALVQFMTLPNLSEFHPKLFGMLAEALMRGLSVVIPSIGVDTNRGVPVLDASRFSRLGSSAVADILTLYRKSETVAARMAMFRIVFLLAVSRVQQRNEREFQPHVLEQCYAALVSLEFFWYMHPLLFYKSRRALTELAGQISYDLDPSDFNNISAVTVSIVQEVLHIAHEDSAIPSSLMDVFVHTGGSDSQQSVQAVLNEAIAVIPSLLRESPDRRLYNLGWRLSVYCIRSSRESLDATMCKTVTRRLARELASCSGSSEDREKQLVRRVLPDTLASLALIARTQPNQALSGFAELLEDFLFSSDVNVTAVSAMSFWTKVIECIAIRNAPTHSHTSPISADASSLILDEFLVIPLSCAEGIGPRVLWALYRALCTEHTIAVCRARHLLVSILAVLETDSAASLRAWQTVAGDPSRKVSRIGEAKRLCIQESLKSADRKS